jgi:hypothetical protein
MRTSEMPISEMRISEKVAHEICAGFGDSDAGQ